MGNSTALSSWLYLNHVLSNIKDEKECTRLLDEELKGKKRINFVLRIHSRFNKLRAERERKQLMEKVT